MGRLPGVIFAASALGALAFAGCGGGDDGADSTAGDDQRTREDEIVATLEKVFTDFEAGDCETYLTAAALEQRALGLPTDDPLEDCEDDAEGGASTDDADSIEVTDITIVDNDATVTVVPDGGSFDGAEVEIELHDFDPWMIDRIGEIDIRDVKRFSEALEFEEDSGYTKSETSCIRRYVEDEVPIEDLENAYVDEDASFVYGAISDCLGGGSDAEAVKTLIRRSLLEEFAPDDVDCIVGRTGRAFNLSVEEFIDQESIPFAVLDSAVRRSVAKCGARPVEEAPS